MFPANLLLKSQESWESLRPLRWLPTRIRSAPSPLAVKAVETHLSQSHVYPESSAPELRAALASRFGLSPDSIILGNGSDEIMEMVAHVFLQLGDEAVMAANAFSMYRICVEAFGGKAVRVPLRDLQV